MNRPSGAESRFVVVYERHLRSVYVYCRRRVSADRVDDVVADVFLTVWRKVDQIPPEGQELPWLYGIAYRSVLHQWRFSSRQKRLKQRLSALGQVGATPPEEQIVRSFEITQVLDAAGRLKDTEQEILRLSLWEELSHGEIAEVLGLTPEAVRQRFSRALKTLTREFNRAVRKSSRSPVVQEGGA